MENNGNKHISAKRGELHSFIHPSIHPAIIDLHVALGGQTDLSQVYPQVRENRKKKHCNATARAAIQYVKQY